MAAGLSARIRHRFCISRTAIGAESVVDGRQLNENEQG